MNASQILECLPDLRVLIVGDVCLDRWCRYAPSLAEASRETGIPRHAVVSTENTPGAAGTIANNLTSLGVGHVSILGAIGNDGFGFELKAAMAARRIHTNLLIAAHDWVTFTYTKLINSDTGVEDQPRTDFVNTADMAETLEKAVIESFRAAAPDFDMILVSDQAETDRGGVVTPRVRESICKFAATNRRKLVWVDSRRRAEHFRGVTVKPNRDEAEAASRRVCGRVDFDALRRHLESRLLVVTLGAEGALLVEESGQTTIPAPSVKPLDICGAGDSFTAGAAPALYLTNSPAEAAAFGNLVASITVQKPGTGTASPEEVLQAEANLP